MPYQDKSTTLWEKKCLATNNGRALAVVQTVIVLSWLPIAITLYGCCSFDDIFDVPLAQPAGAAFVSWPFEKFLRNIELINLTTTIGALCPRKSKVADHSLLSSTGAECLGFWKPWVVVMKWPQGDHASRLKNVEPSCRKKESKKGLHWGHVDHSKLQNSGNITYRFFPMAFCLVSKTPVTCTPYYNSLIIWLACNERANRIPSNTFDQAGMPSQDGSAHTIGHVPYVNSIIQAATSQCWIIRGPIKIYLL